MRVLSAVVAIALAFALFAETRVYDDLGNVDTSEDSTNFWYVTGHTGAVVRAEAQTLSGSFYAAPYVVRSSPGDTPFDGRIFTSAYGDIKDVRTRNSGSLLIVR